MIVFHSGKESPVQLRAMGHWVGGLVPGLALSAALGVAATQLARLSWLQSHGISALTIAIVIGMAVGNTVYSQRSTVAGEGVSFSKQALLRLGIVLYGMRLTYQDIAHVGWRGIAIDLAVVISTFALAWLVGTRLLGLDRRTAMLVGAGSSICGAAAVMATEPVVRGRPEQVTVAVSTVVVFGTLAIFLYPALYRFNALHRFIVLSDASYGLFAGSTIHEVAQVVAAGHAVGDRAATVAVIAKMVRVMMLAPFLFVLSSLTSRTNSPCESALSAPRRSPVVIPWFAVAFMAVAGLNSLAWVPAPWVNLITDADNALLATAMAALGLTTQIAAIRHAGFKPLLLALVLFTWLLGGGLAINLLLSPGR